MQYPLNILEDSLNEIEQAKELCKKNKNMVDYYTIEKQLAMPLRIAINLIKLAVENELKFNIIVDNV